MPSGRARQFDVDEALDRALEVFWARGYEGATLPELTMAMGINRPSLYAAFGNKEQLFRKALDRYQTGPMAFLTDALRKPTARAVVEAIFSGFVRMQRDRDKARGCLIVSGALACGEEAETVRPRVGSIETSDSNGVTGKSGSSGPCRTATCRRGPIARRSRTAHRHGAERPGSSVGQQGRPRRSCDWFRLRPCKHGRLDPSPRWVFSMFWRMRSKSAPRPQGRTLPSTGSGW